MFLNIGCGSRFSRDIRWVNIDLISTDSAVRSVDVANGLPFEDNYFAAAYHSHVLEHLDKRKGQELLKECFRVLEPGGVLRIVVPDLEQIAICYLDRLMEARKGGEGAMRRYAWALLELCDQMTRCQNGGGMMEFLANPEPAGRAYAESRWGAEMRSVVATLHRSTNRAETPVNRQSLRLWIRKLRERLISSLLGKDYAALKVGRFVVCGELHKWMYDSFSLSILLNDIGFSSIVVRNATESYIDGWAKFELDADALAAAHKPDSLFIEAIKPRLAV